MEVRFSVRDDGQVDVHLGPEWPIFNVALNDSISSLPPRGWTGNGPSTYWTGSTMPHGAPSTRSSVATTGPSPGGTRRFSAFVATRSWPTSIGSNPTNLEKRCRSTTSSHCSPSGAVKWRKARQRQRLLCRRLIGGTRRAGHPGVAPGADGPPDHQRALRPGQALLLQGSAALHLERTS